MLNNISITYVDGSKRIICVSEEFYGRKKENVLVVKDKCISLAEDVGRRDVLKLVITRNGKVLIDFINKESRHFVPKKKVH